MRLTPKNAVDLLTVVVLAAALGVYWAKATSSTPVWVEPIDLGAFGVDFSKAELTLIFALQRDCRYCQQSLPFYRRLVASSRQHSASVQFAVASPPEDSEIRAYLASHGIVPDVFVTLIASEVPVRSTPTLFLSNQEGTLVGVWLGVLSEVQERELMAQLVGSLS